MEFMNHITNLHANRLALFLLLHYLILRLREKFLTEKAGRSKIEQFQSSTAGRPLEGNTYSKYQSLCKCTKLVDAFRKSVRCSIQKLRNHPELSERKQRKEV